MSTQQDIYAAGSKSRPPMLNKENYVPWSSRLLRYVKSRPNGKLIHNSIINGPYVRRMISEPGVDSCKTAQEIWLRVQQMMKGFDIGIQEKKAKLFNEWERFTSNEGESIESYYHCFLKLMNDLKRNKHFPEKIASNLKFLNNLQPEWSRRVTIVHQTKDLHTADYTQLHIAQPGMNIGQDRQIQMVGARAEGSDVGHNANLDEIKEANANCILMVNLQQASTSGTQTDKAPVYDSDGSAEVHEYENCYDNKIFNMFTQEEQYTELLKPIPKQHQVPQNDNNVISEVTIMEQSRETVEQHPVNFEF
nr:hypothetical protein [Tanacetum cinerariifolium]